MDKAISIVIDYIDGSDNPNWEDFHKEYPEVEFWEYEAGIKAYQEM